MLRSMTLKGHKLSYSVSHSPGFVFLPVYKTLTLSGHGKHCFSDPIGLMAQCRSAFFKPFLKSHTYLGR